MNKKTKQEQIKENANARRANEFLHNLYNAGYRKAEEVRKETAKEILSDLLDLHNSVQDRKQKTDFYYSIEQLIAEIEIKYNIEAEE